MIEWLLVFALFWLIASVQFGGLLDAENGSGLQQFLGLIATLVLFLAVFFVLRLALGGLGVLGRLVLPAAASLLALGWIGRVGFRLAGVTLKRSRFSADLH